MTDRMLSATETDRSKTMTTTCKLAWDAKCADCGGVMPVGSHAQYSDETGLAMHHINGCPETRIALGVCEQDRVWRSHTGYLFKWGKAGSSWLSKAPDADEWVELHIRTAFADARTPFVRVAT